MRARVMWPVVTLLAGFYVIYIYSIVGGIAVVYPLIFSGWFLFAFFTIYLYAAIQASATPGLEKLHEPSFWLSAVGIPYLYVTDRKRWTLYASLSAYFSGVLLGTPIGFIIVGRAITLNMISSLGAFASWFAGAFFVFLITVTLNVFASSGTPEVALQKPVQRGPKKVCPKCGREMWFDFKICPSCGELLLS